ncbi:hypothetical protein CMQ_4214 [Grosmannia clavigera kw1407]|uniref:Sister chromatid cohesion protein n=1 Tax=Grosmannia clavigera (strain kw1407 / UAMH 11150) TaxID=655863 RepID=F0X8H0_GROCL|nr:uncharacterized protein CMQ_4214 [Grosmannia clavigera kw1407]EFX06145.1 hypothetical protein CMQ_4214 [Grosmannia clavigera kw1407]
MASQDSATSIPFISAPDGSGYRLLELPADLVAEGSSPWYLHTDSSGMARLRTAQGKTYALRQKNTSNALMLLSVRANAVDATDETALPRPGVAIAATVHETVELLEVAAETTVPAPAPKVVPSRGKWHEKFGKTR